MELSGAALCDEVLCLVANQCDACDLGRHQVLGFQVLQTEPCSCLMGSTVVPVQRLTNALVVQQVLASQHLHIWLLRPCRFAFGLVRCGFQQLRKVH